MANAVVPIMLGQDYQARFFWTEACRLFQPRSKVIEVAYDLNDIKAFDDIVVYYSTPILGERGESVAADYYQIKYHVNQAGSVTCEALADPAFIGASKICLLERLRDAQLKYAPDGINCRFHLVLPWPIHPDDPLALLVGNQGGEIRLDVLFDGKGPGSKMGKIRYAWRRRLGLQNDDELRCVLTPLRIHANASNLAGLQKTLDGLLWQAGFMPVPEDCQVHPYDDLIRKLRCNDRYRFTRDELKTICEQEELWRGQPHLPSDAKQLGIRSFSRWAEHMEDETDECLCFLNHFEDRYIKKENLWHSNIGPELVGFLANNVQPGGVYDVHLDTHSAVAFTAGYCLDSKCGADVAPVQRTRSGRVAWRASTNIASQPAALWSSEEHVCNSEGNEVALAIGITHDILPDVNEYVQKSLPGVRRIIICRPQTAAGSTAIRDGTHALHMAQQLSALVKRERTADEKENLLHIFAAAPNGLMFIIGQHARGFGKCTLYEFDFEGNRSGAYQPAIVLPNDVSSTCNSIN